MKLTDISIRRSGVMRAWVMEISVMTPSGEMKSTQHFDDFGGFLTAVKEAGTFFAVRLGRIKSQEANDRLLTRVVAPNPDGAVR
jgi:hypothetical protein